jgi:hypothetical protein
VHPILLNQDNKGESYGDEVGISITALSQSVVKLEGWDGQLIFGDLHTQRP